MWDDGIYLGMKGGTGEIIVGGQEGRLEDTDGQAEDVGGTVESREFGIDWRSAVEDDGGEGGRRRGAQDGSDDYG